MNHAAPLPGRNQTNQRAELLAAIKACETDYRPIEIRSDSQYVVRGVRTWPIWQARGWHGTNADLWQRMNALIAADPARIQIEKVKGHATWMDVSLGNISQQDKIGRNGEADRLAREGADAHASVMPLVNRALRRKRLARDYQQIRLDILSAREAALALLPEHITAPPMQLLRDRIALRPPS